MSDIQPSYVSILQAELFKLKQTVLEMETTIYEFRYKEYLRGEWSEEYMHCIGEYVSYYVTLLGDREWAEMRELKEYVFTIDSNIHHKDWGRLVATEIKIRALNPDN